MKDTKLDGEIKTRFQEFLNQARNCELFKWRNTSRGRLAEIIVLDQFPRNIHRETPASFSADPQALTLSQEALNVSDHHHLETQQKAFLYMPFMHSESLLIQDESGHLFEHLGIEDYVKICWASLVWLNQQITPTLQRRKTGYSIALKTT